MRTDPKNNAQSTPATDAVADWVRRLNTEHFVAAVETAGGQFVLGNRAVQYLVVDLATRKFAWREFVAQCAFMASTSIIPTLFVAIPIGVTLAIQFGLLAGQVGGTSLAGAATGLAVIKQGAPLVAAILMSSAVGSAIAADLGSRTVREEIDAMEVMGVSPLRRLVVPRLAAGVAVGVALTGITCFIGFIAGYMFNIFVQHGTPGSFVSTFSSFATVPDLIVTLVKAAIFGAIVTIVACAKGLDCRGGPAGVANAVNAAVVVAILLLMTVNVVITQLYITLFPDAGGLS